MGMLPEDFELSDSFNFFEDNLELYELYGEDGYVIDPIELHCTWDSDLEAPSMEQTVLATYSDLSKNHVSCLGLRISRELLEEISETLIIKLKDYAKELDVPERILYKSLKGVIDEQFKSIQESK